MNRKDSNLQKRIGSIDKMIDFIDDEYKVATNVRIFIGNTLMSKSCALISEENIKRFQCEVKKLLIDERKQLKKELK